MVVLNKALLAEPKNCAFELNGARVTWGAINGRVLRTETTHMPSSLMLAIHAKNAVRFAIGMGWCQAGEVVIPPSSGADQRILEEYLVSQSTSESQEPEDHDSSTPPESEGE